MHRVNCRLGERFAQVRFTVDNKFRRVLDLSFRALHALKETADSVLFTSRGHGRLGLLGKGWQPIGWSSEECEGGAEHEIS